MPYGISKGGGTCGKTQWAVLNKQTGKSMGCHSSRKSALKQLAALNVNVKETTVTKPLRESTGLLEAPTNGTSGSRRNIQIITPGWGSSGYYSAEVLERAATNKVIPAGTHMYLNHMSETERHDRPGRDVEKIGAVLVEDATWDGTRLMAPADLIGPHAELIESLAPYIGVSISGSATDITIGEAEGRTGPIIEDLAVVNSVDFVTHAGRGGMVLLESARPSHVNALAVSHGVAEATANDTREALQTALREEYGGEKSWVWVRDFDDTTVWFEHETPDESGTWAEGYTLADNGAVTLAGGRVEVRARTEYVPVSPAGNSTEESREDAMTTTPEGAAPATEAATTSTEGTEGTETTSEATGVTEATTTETSGTTPAEPAAAATESTTSPTEENTMTHTPGAGGTAPTNPRQLMEAQIAAQGRQIAQMQAQNRARDIIAEVLASGWIGEAQRARLTGQLLANVPLTEAGELDEPTLRTRVTEALEATESEAAEILQAAGYGTPRGLGALSTPATAAATEKVSADLAESLSGAFGLSESATKTAVKGR